MAHVRAGRCITGAPGDMVILSHSTDFILDLLIQT